MKKVLILAYDFPPYVSVGGLRPYAWYKYFKEFDIYPIIVTRQWNNFYKNHLDYVAPGFSSSVVVEHDEYGTQIKAPYKPNLANKHILKYGDIKFRLFRKSISAFYEIAQWFSPIGAKYNLYIEANRFLKKNKVETIIATGDPFILFKYASKLSRKYNIPWIADYRDPWVQDQTKSNAFFHEIFSKWLENRYLKNVTCITTVSDYFVSVISENLSKSLFKVVPNGYDDELINNCNHISQNKQVLTISFAGSILEYHPIISFLNGVLEYIKEANTPNIKICFYGINNENDIRGLISNDYKELLELIEFEPKMENSLVLEKMAASSLLLLFNYYSIIGTKIYDYLGLKRKILLCFSQDKYSEALKTKYYHINPRKGCSEKAQEDLILSTESGIVIKDPNHLKESLHIFLTEHKEKGFIKCNSINIDEFSRKNQTGKLAEIISNISK
jgi:hypothetical protein